MDYFGLLKLMPPTKMLPKMPKTSADSTNSRVGGEDGGINKISREDQDALALASHQRAAAAHEAGHLAAEVTAVEVNQAPSRRTRSCAATPAWRSGSAAPGFAADGTVTAANASTLTDGASATLLMSEARRASSAPTPLAAFRSWAYVGVDPRDQLLKGPALAMPSTGARGMELSEIDFIDMHEAFAAQVLSRCWSRTSPRRPDASPP